MRKYILPVQQVLLEYVLKLGKVIFFPGNAAIDDINRSKLSDDEKNTLEGIISNNRDFFDAFHNTAFILMSSVYDAKMIKDNEHVLESMFSEAEKALDYIRIKECPFLRPEYYIGIAGLVEDTRALITINDDYKLEFYIPCNHYYYLMQKGMGLDISSREDDDTDLYSILYSDRTDEVYCKYRQIMSETCEALKITDESRCFVYLFSKLDGMGLCDTFSFKINKRRILSVIAHNQHEFDLQSNQLYFYSKNIRTEVVHKGRKITELVSLDVAEKINQTLFDTIIAFCRAAIQTNIHCLNDFKAYLANSENKYDYNIPLENKVSPAHIQEITYSTYIAFVEGLEVDHAAKRGDYFLLPSKRKYGFREYYKNYVAKDIGEPYDKKYESFSVDDLELITEILYRLKQDPRDDSAIIIGTHIPDLLKDDIESPINREKFVDYVCNNMNMVLYYDMLNGGKIVNDAILPPRVGIKDNIRCVFEFVDDGRRAYIRELSGRVYGQYIIPEKPYKCMITNRDELYDILFNNKNAIVDFYRNVLVNVCEAEYMVDLTLKISFLFDVFDSLEPNSHEGKNAIKYVFTYLSHDRRDYNKNKQKFEQIRKKYRNPILHGGRNVFEIEQSINKIYCLIGYLNDIIIDFCLKIASSEISSWSEFKEEYERHQGRLGLK